MAIGERIRFIRNLRGMTQKYLGMAIGFDVRTADIRMAQYESGTRTPKDTMVHTIAHALEVSPQALTVPDIDTDIGLMHTFFTLEDRYGLKITRIDGKVCLTPDINHPNYHSIFEHLNSWNKEAEKLKSGEITEEDYNTWRYTYPEVEAQRFRDAMDAARLNAKREMPKND